MVLKPKTWYWKFAFPLKHLNFQRSGTPRNRDGGAQAPARSGNDHPAAAQVQDTSQLLPRLQRRIPAGLPGPRSEGSALPELSEAVPEAVPPLASQRALVHRRHAEQPPAERRQRDRVKLNQVWSVRAFKERQWSLFEMAGVFCFAEEDVWKLLLLKAKFVIFLQFFFWKFLSLIFFKQLLHLFFSEIV